MSAIVTAWEGSEFDEIAGMTVPLMRRYAERHGHSLTIGSLPGEVRRPSSWKKLAVIAECLQEHDAVLWLDCDVVVVGQSVDIFGEIPSGCVQAMVRHACVDGDVPNAGVWFVTREMISTLITAAMMDAYLSHRWWEQGAMLALMGFEESGGISRHSNATDLYKKTHWLHESWNVWQGSPAGTAIRFFHACGVTHERAAYIRGVINAVIGC